MIPTNLTAKEACLLALKHRLFVSGWALHDELVHCERGGARHAAVFLGDGGVPIGVAVIGHYHDIQVFVRKNQRRKGIGRKLVEHMRATLDSDTVKRMDASYGAKGSLDFWKAVGVPLW